jgi:hypothetical protein
MILTGDDVEDPTVLRLLLVDLLKSNGVIFTERGVGLATARGVSRVEYRHNGSTIIICPIS